MIVDYQRMFDKWSNYIKKSSKRKSEVYDNIKVNNNTFIKSKRTNKKN